MGSPVSREEDCAGGSNRFACSQAGLSGHFLLTLWSSPWRRCGLSPYCLTARCIFWCSARQGISTLHCIHVGELQVGTCQINAPGRVGHKAELLTLWVGEIRPSCSCAWEWESETGHGCHQSCGTRKGKVRNMQVKMRRNTIAFKVLI